MINEDTERKMTTNTKDRRRGDDKPDPEKELTPEDVARSMIGLPAGHQWEYLKKEKNRK